jgi:hypothetical protein
MSFDKAAALTPSSSLIECTGSYIDAMTGVMCLGVLLAQLCPELNASPEDEVCIATVVAVVSKSVARGAAC